MNAKEVLKKIWDNPKNKRYIKDIVLFGVATVAFHFLYWNTDMNSWLFGPFTSEVFDFFTDIAYCGCAFLLGQFCDIPYDTFGRDFLFYTQNDIGLKQYYAHMTIVHDCSAIKQLMQFLLIIVLCSGKWWKKGIYYLVGCILLVLANILRIYLLTILFANNPADFQFYHDWVARPLMYVVIFSLWVVWIEYFAYRKPKNENSPSKH